VPKPFNAPYHEVVSDLKRHVEGWKKCHRLSDVQVATILAQIAGPYGEAAYVELAREDKEGRPDRVPRIPLAADAEAERAKAAAIQAAKDDALLTKAEAIRRRASDK
jgi:hypothetical protein